MEAFDPDFTPNGSDGSSRYTYKKQPDICRWNLIKLAEALDPVLPLHESMLVIESNYTKLFESEYYNIMKRKLGLIK